MNEIDFIIAVRDRDDERIQKCIDSIKPLAKSIIVVDYGSKVPVKVNDATVIRYTNSKIWNKSHALNLGIKSSNAPYICTIDCDFVLDELVLEAIKNNLGEFNVIFNTNVRRIESKDLTNNFKQNFIKSKPWFDDAYHNLYSRANGGIQVFHRKFINAINGYDEGLGAYWGAMDNRIYEQAKGKNMTVIDLNIPMFHQEHEHKKEDNLSEDERDTATYLRAYKSYLLKELIKKGDYIGRPDWGNELPNHDWIFEELKEFKEKSIPKAKVCISITSNFEFLPTYFVIDLISMINYASKFGVTCSVFSSRNSMGIDMIRNSAVDFARESGCDYVLHLDTDHHYPHNTLVKLLQHKKPFVCGVYCKRTTPFEYVQYKNPMKIPINTPKNTYKAEELNGLMRIGASGTAGNLVHIGVYDRISKPYYEFTTTKKGGKLYKSGEDVNFCRKLHKAGIEVWCDTSLSYPHHVTTFFADRGNIVQY